MLRGLLWNLLRAIPMWMNEVMTEYLGSARTPTRAEKLRANILIAFVVVLVVSVIYSAYTNR